MSASRVVIPLNPILVLSFGRDANCMLILYLVSPRRFTKNFDEIAKLHADAKNG